MSILNLSSTPRFITSRIGLGLSTAFSGFKSRAKDTQMPSRTNVAASRLRAGVMRFSVPSWSFLPHLPQLETCLKSSSNCTFVRCSREGSVAACPLATDATAKDVNAAPMPFKYERRSISAPPIFSDPIGDSSTCPGRVQVIALRTSSRERASNASNPRSDPATKGVPHSITIAESQKIAF